MKNSKTMYLLAKAKAIDYGARQYGRYAGYYLTKDELRILYAEEGFNTDRPTMDNHVGAWRDLSRVYALKPEGMEEVAYFFRLDDMEDVRHIYTAEKAFPTMHWTGAKAVMNR